MLRVSNMVSASTPYFTPLSGSANNQTSYLTLGFPDSSRLADRVKLLETDFFFGKVVSSSPRTFLAVMPMTRGAMPKKGGLPQVSKWFRQCDVHCNHL